MKIIAPIMLCCFMSLFAQGADPKTNWTNNCMQCHGPDGSANTSMGKALSARDLTSAQIQSSFTDAQAAAAIKDARLARHYSLTCNCGESAVERWHGKFAVTAKTKT